MRPPTCSFRVELRVCRKLQPARHGTGWARASGALAGYAPSCATSGRSVMGDGVYCVCNPTSSRDFRVPMTRQMKPITKPFASGLVK